MRKTEIKKAKDNELIVENINTYANLILNYNAGLGTKQLEKHFNDLSSELVSRGILTNEDVEILNK